jgi:hypothetical protein
MRREVGSSGSLHQTIEIKRSLLLRPTDGLLFVEPPLDMASLLARVPISVAELDPGLTINCSAAGTDRTQQAALATTRPAPAWPVVTSR